MKTDICWRCGQEVEVKKNQRLAPHNIGASRCLGSSQFCSDYEAPKQKRWNKKKRVLRYDTI